MDGAQHESILFQHPQCLRQHLLTHTANKVCQFAEAIAAFQQGYQHKRCRSTSTSAPQRDVTSSRMLRVGQSDAHKFPFRMRIVFVLFGHGMDTAYLWVCTYLTKLKRLRESANRF